LTEKVDLYALAATLLFSLIGADFTGHDIAQADTDRDRSPMGLLDLRARLARVHAARARQPLPAAALPHVTGAPRERLKRAFARWLSLDPLHRPSARAFIDELDVLLEWDAEVARKQAAREFRSTLSGVAFGLSLAACVGGFVGYEWHKRTMGEAKQATSAALKKADKASAELHRASANLDKIIADPALDAVAKAKKISDVVESLEAESVGLLAANVQLQHNEAAANEARVRAQQQKVASDVALVKAQAERDAARSEQSLAQTAVWKAEAERDQARGDQASADAARAKAESERAQFQQDKVAAEAARSAVEGERDRLAQELTAAFAKGVESGAAGHAAPSPSD
jgi:hypothetical protein